MLVFTPDDFDSLLREHPLGETRGRPKGDLRKRLSAWARALQRRLERQDLSLVPLFLAERLPAGDGSGAERSCETVAFVRVDGELEPAPGRPATHAARAHDLRAVAHTARSRHVSLLLRLDAEGVEVGLEVHSSARSELDLLLALLSTEAPSAADDLVDAVRGLPEQFILRLGHEPVGACNDATVEGLRALARRARAARRSLWIGWRLSRDVALANHDIVGEQLGDALVAIAPVFVLCASPEGAWPGDTASARPRAPRGPLAPRRGTAVARPSPRLSRSGTRGSRAVVTRRAVDGSPPAAEGSAIASGMKVRVRAGAFAEKTGVVTGVDSRGVRVLLGLLAARFAQDDLEPVVDRTSRPTLSSSHRRAAPNRKLRG